MTQEQYNVYAIENDHLKVVVSNYGATCLSIQDKKTGIDILKGYDTIPEYQQDPGTHTGGFIGRTANRTRNAQFKIHNSTYHITVNENGVTNLHGGTGFDKRIFEVEKQTPTEITMSYFSPDGEEGYPGNLEVKITYQLEQTSLKMLIRATSDQNTVFAITNHNYYNIDGADKDDFGTQEVQLFASQYAKNDELGISILPLEDVENTPFDFRTSKQLSKDLQSEDPQIQLAKGYDHHFAIEGEGLRPFAKYTGEHLQMTVYADLPGMHMYTGNYYDVIGKHGHHDIPHSAVCFEPEYFPNAINEQGVKQPILKAHESMTNQIVIELEPKK